MTPYPGAESGNLRRVAIPVILFASVIVNGVLLGMFFWRGDRTDRERDERSERERGVQARSASPGNTGPRDRAGSPERLDGATVPPPSRKDSGPAYTPRPRIPGAGDARSDDERRLAEEAAAVARPGGSSSAEAERAAIAGRPSDSTRSTAPDPGSEKVESRAFLPQARTAGSRSEDERSAVETPEIEKDPESDRTPPVLLSMRMDPPEIADGNTSILTIDMSDDLSGVQSVAGRIRSPSGAALLPFEAQSQGGSNLFAAIVKIPSRAETGYWYVSDLFASDRARNPLIANFTAATVPAGGALLVSSPDSDSKPPTVHDVSVENRTASGGEKNKVRIAIDDDRSGVASIWGAFQSPSRNAIINFSCRPGPVEGVWEGIFEIPSNADCGEWTLQQLWVADKAGNSVRLGSETPEVARVVFYVSSETCDSSAPVLEWLGLSPASVSNETASEIQLTATVRDEGTGANSMFASVTGPVSTNGQVPRMSIQCARASNDPEAPWVGKILVPQFAAKGVWRVALVRLQDRAFNIRDYRPDDPVLAQAVFEVR